MSNKENTPLETSDIILDSNKLALNESINTKYDMKFHLVIVENESTVTNNLPSHSVYKVADCFVNPLLKDVTKSLKELCYGRPSDVQSILNKAIEEINKLDNQSF